MDGTAMRHGCPLPRFEVNAVSHLGRKSAVIATLNKALRLAWQHDPWRTHHLANSLQGV
jgi:hypothetical protein